MAAVGMLVLVLVLVALVLAKLPIGVVATWARRAAVAVRSYGPLVFRSALVPTFAALRHRFCHVS